MTETQPADSTAAPDAIAGVLRDAPFVRLIARDDGDSLAAAGLLARTLRARNTPFQARVSADPVPDAPGDDVPVVVGADVGPHAISGEGSPASTTAFAVARELGVDPHPVLALAGVVAAGSVPGTDGSGDALDAAERAGHVERRPGVGIPTADLADGLSASTLLWAPYSGQPEEARAALAELDLPATLDDDAHRRLASLVAVDVAAMEEASTRAASAVERALRPYALVTNDATVADGTAVADGAPFATVAGYADVLEALAREAPGTGIALALADDPSDSLRSATLDAWRTHGLAAHRAVTDASLGRYDGATVVRVDASTATLPTVARLVRDFRSPEPIAIALSEEGGALAVAATEPVGVGDTLRDLAVEFDGEGWGSPTRGAASFDGDGTDLAAALRGAL